MGVLSVYGQAIGETAQALVPCLLLRIIRQCLRSFLTLKMHDRKELTGVIDIP